MFPRAAMLLLLASGQVCDVLLLCCCWRAGAAGDPTHVHGQRPGGGAEPGLLPRGPGREPAPHALAPVLRVRGAAAARGQGPARRAALLHALADPQEVRARARAPQAKRCGGNLVLC